MNETGDVEKELNRTYFFFTWMVEQCLSGRAVNYGKLSIVIRLQLFSIT